jgi:hypothetical protein
MKKMIFFLLLLCVMAQNIAAQSDTIFTLNKAIPCTITEMGISELKYTKPTNKAMQIVMPLSYINRIKYADGEVTIFDSTLIITPHPNDTALHPTVLSHLKSEAEGLQFIGKITVPVAADYYYNIANRPNASKLPGIYETAKIYGADLVLLESNNLGSSTSESGYISYSATVSLYALQLRNFDSLFSKINTEKVYPCIYERQLADETDYLKAKLVILKMYHSNNRCYLEFKLNHGYAAAIFNTAEVVYFDDTKFEAVFKGDRGRERKIIFNFNE